MTAAAAARERRGGVGDGAAGGGGGGGGGKHIDIAAVHVLCGLTLLSRDQLLDQLAPRRGETQRSHHTALSHLLVTSPPRYLLRKCFTHLDRTFCSRCERFVARGPRWAQSAPARFQAIVQHRIVRSADVRWSADRGVSEGSKKWAFVKEIYNCARIFDKRVFYR